MAKHSGMARTRLEPDIDDVHLFAKFFSSTFLACRSEGKDRSRVMPVPGIRAFFRKQLDNFPVHLWRAEQFVAVAVATEKYRDGNSPDALPRDAPIRTRLDHVADAQLAPLRVPLYFLDLVERARAQC